MKVSDIVIILHYEDYVKKFKKKNVQVVLEIYKKR